MQVSIGLNNTLNKWQLLKNSLGWRRQSATQSAMCLPQSAIHQSLLSSCKE